ncbi:hypothetical protein QJS66_02160 [Kocuria rhizophila]|nr:hypothetical protein QJS66_02160 [Kocuria rhizophila]
MYAGVPWRWACGVRGTACPAAAKRRTWWRVPVRPVRRVCVGLGVSTREHVLEIGEYADGDAWARRWCAHCGGPAVRGPWDAWPRGSRDEREGLVVQASIPWPAIGGSPHRLPHHPLLRAVHPAGRRRWPCG